MFDDDVPGREEEPRSPRTTIVGGRPPETNAKGPAVPTGIQRLLRLAAVDDAFRAQLLEKRDLAAPAAGVELTATERAVLRAASEAQLDAMAKHLPPPTSARRDFFRQTAATAAALLAGPVLLACEGCGAGAVKGSRPDVPPPPPPPDDGGFAEPPPERPDQNPMQTEGGAAPDEPPPPPPPPYPAPTGIAPDVPPKSK